MNKTNLKLILPLTFLLFLSSGCVEHFAKPPQTKLSTKSILKLTYKPLRVITDKEQLFITGLNKISSFNRAIKQQWSRTIKSEILTVALAPKYLLITTQKKQAILIKRHDGTSYLFGLDNLVAIKPVYHNGTFYLFDYSGSIIAINFATTRIQKKHATKLRFSNQIGKHGDNLFFGSFDKHLLRLSTKDNKISSITKVHFKPDTITLFYKKSYIVGGKNCNLYKFSIEENMIEHMIKEKGWIQNPQINNGRIYYTTVLNRLVVRDADDLRLLFDFEVPTKLTRPLIFKNSIFIANENGTIFQISKKNGLLQGKLKLKKSELSPIFLFNDKIYLIKGKKLLRLTSETLTTDTRDLFKR